MPAPARGFKEGTIAAVCAWKLRELAIAAGVPTRSMDHVDLPKVAAKALETRIPFERQVEVWEAAVRALRDPGFPITVASRLRPSDYGVIGFACMTRASLGDALRQAIRYQRIWSDATGWELTERGGAATLTFLCEDPGRLGVRCNIECAIAEMVGAARAVSGRDVVPREVRFRHPKPEDPSAHEAFFRSPVRFDAAANELRFDRTLLDAPLLKADPALAAFFQRHTDSILRDLLPSESIESRLLAWLIDETRSGIPTLEAAAKSLGTSSRTLRRRLRDAGTGFQEVLDRARLELAKRYLAEPGMALGEISFLLGFSEPSAFHRAFKRWTGLTPLAHRQACGRSGQSFGQTRHFPP